MVIKYSVLDNEEVCGIHIHISSENVHIYKEDWKFILAHIVLKNGPN